jgi:hypothetical protein
MEMGGRRVILGGRPRMAARAKGLARRLAILMVQALLGVHPSGVGVLVNVRRRALMCHGNVYCCMYWC